MNTGNEKHAIRLTDDQLENVSGGRVVPIHFEQSADHFDVRFAGSGRPASNPFHRGSNPNGGRRRRHPNGVPETE